jgi:hypothetical protein
MPQVTFYLDDETDRRARAAAAASGLSYRQWLAGLIRASTAESWPDSVRALAGGIPDFPTVDEMYRATPADVPRVSVDC